MPSVSGRDRQHSALCMGNVHIKYIIPLDAYAKSPINWPNVNSMSLVCWDYCGSPESLGHAQIFELGNIENTHNSK